MNGWARIVWSLGLAATLGWIGAGAFGYRVVDQATLGLHTLASFAALLALLLAHGWMAVFALTSRNLVARVAGATSPALASACRATFLAGVLAILAASAQFSVSNALFPSRLAARTHAAAAAASIVVLVAALAVQARGLAAHGRAIAELDRAPGSW